MTDFIDVDHMALKVRNSIIDDPNLSEGHKHGVLNACKDKGTEAEVSDAFWDFCQSNRLVGTQIIDYNNTQFVGHVKTLESVSRYISKTLRTHPDPIIYEPHLIESHIRALGLPGAPLRKKEATFWFDQELFSRIPTYQVSGRPTWLFEGEDSDDARTLFDPNDVTDLPSRLGLPEPKLWGSTPYAYTTGIEFVGFAFEGSKIINSRRPTALDGDYNSVKQIWLIGGRTQPLPHGPMNAKNLGGLMESVSDPTHLSDGIENVYLFTS